MPEDLSSSQLLRRQWQASRRPCFLLCCVWQGVRELGIDYDEIAFDKPVADLYIDGRAGKPSEDMEKEVRHGSWRTRKIPGGILFHTPPVLCYCTPHLITCCARFLSFAIPSTVIKAVFAESSYFYFAKWTLQFLFWVPCRVSPWTAEYSADIFFLELLRRINFCNRKFTGRLITCCRIHYMRRNWCHAKSYRRSTYLSILHM